MFKGATGGSSARISTVMLGEDLTSDSTRYTPSDGRDIDINERYTGVNIALRNSSHAVCPEDNSARAVLRHLN
ncbi:MAG: hypothetical protein QOI01_6210, partial [Mycobacterium sp.]|nr:hypothetical protein [Mycobacterium sp.]